MQRDLVVVIQYGIICTRYWYRYYRTE